MQVNIRPLQKEELADAIRLSLDTFMECGKNDYDDNGLEVFKSFIHDEGKLAELYFIGAFHGERLIGVLAFHQRDKHISLFFVHSDYHRRGIGRDLFSVLSNAEEHSVMTVNSSTYAVSFYESLGFKKLGVAQSYYGLVSVPMKREL